MKGPLYEVAAVTPYTERLQRNLYETRLNKAQSLPPISALFTTGRANEHNLTSCEQTIHENEAGPQKPRPLPPVSALFTAAAGHDEDCSRTSHESALQDFDPVPTISALLTEEREDGGSASGSLTVDPATMGVMAAVDPTVKPDCPDGADSTHSAGESGGTLSAAGTTGLNVQTVAAEQPAPLTDSDCLGTISHSYDVISGFDDVLCPPHAGFDFNTVSGPTPTESEFNSISCPAIAQCSFGTASFRTNTDSVIDTAPDQTKAGSTFNTEEANQNHLPETSNDPSYAVPFHDIEEEQLRLQAQETSDVMWGSQAGWAVDECIATAASIAGQGALEFGEPLHKSSTISAESISSWEWPTSSSDHRQASSSSMSMSSSSSLSWWRGGSVGSTISQEFSVDDAPLLVSTKMELGDKFNSEAEIWEAMRKANDGRGGETISSSAALVNSSHEGGLSCFDGEFNIPELDTNGNVTYDFLRSLADTGRKTTEDITEGLGVVESSADALVFNEASRLSHSSLRERYFEDSLQTLATQLYELQNTTNNASFTTEPPKSKSYRDVLLGAPVTAKSNWNASTNKNKEMDESSNLPPTKGVTNVSLCEPEQLTADAGDKLVQSTASVVSKDVLVYESMDYYSATSFSPQSFSDSGATSAGESAGELYQTAVSRMRDSGDESSACASDSGGSDRRGPQNGGDTTRYSSNILCKSRKDNRETGKDTKDRLLVTSDDEEEGGHLADVECSYKVDVIHGHNGGTLREGTGRGRKRTRALRRGQRPDRLNLIPCGSGTGITEDMGVIDGFVAASNSHDTSLSDNCPSTRSSSATSSASGKTASSRDASCCSTSRSSSVVSSSSSSSVHTEPEPPVTRLNPECPPFIPRAERLRALADSTATNDAVASVPDADNNPEVNNSAPTNLYGNVNQEQQYDRFALDRSLMPPPSTAVVPGASTHHQHHRRLNQMRFSASFPADSGIGSSSCDTTGQCNSSANTTGWQSPTAKHPGDHLKPILDVTGAPDDSVFLGADMPSKQSNVARRAENLIPGCSDTTENNFNERNIRKDLQVDSNGNRDVFLNISDESRLLQPPYSCKLEHHSDFVTIEDVQTSAREKPKGCGGSLLLESLRSPAVVETLLSISQRVVRLRVKKPLSPLSARPESVSKVSQSYHLDPSFLDEKASGRPEYDHYGTGFVYSMDRDHFEVRTHEAVIANAEEALRTDVTFELSLPDGKQFVAVVRGADVGDGSGSRSSSAARDDTESGANINAGSGAGSNAEYDARQVNFSSHSHSQVTSFRRATPPELIPWLHVFQPVPVLARESLFEDSCYFTDSSSESSMVDATELGVSQQGDAILSPSANAKGQASLSKQRFDFSAAPKENDKPCHFRGDVFNCDSVHMKNGDFQKDVRFPNCSSDVKAKRSSSIESKEYATTYVENDKPFQFVRDVWNYNLDHGIVATETSSCAMKSLEARGTEDSENFVSRPSPQEMSCFAPEEGNGNDYPSWDSIVKQTGDMEAMIAESPACPWTYGGNDRIAVNSLHESVPRENLVHAINTCVTNNWGYPWKEGQDTNQKCGATDDYNHARGEYVNETLPENTYYYDHAGFSYDKQNTDNAYYEHPFDGNNDIRNNGGRGTLCQSDYPTSTTDTVNNPWPHGCFEPYPPNEQHYGVSTTWNDMPASYHSRYRSDCEMVAGVDLYNAKDDPALVSQYVEQTKPTNYWPLKPMVEDSNRTDRWTYVSQGNYGSIGDQNVHVGDEWSSYTPPTDIRTREESGGMRHFAESCAMAGGRGSTRLYQRGGLSGMGQLGGDGESGLADHIAGGDNGPDHADRTGEQAGRLASLGVDVQARRMASNGLAEGTGGPCRLTPGGATAGEFEQSSNSSSRRRSQRVRTIEETDQRPSSPMVIMERRAAKAAKATLTGVGECPYGGLDLFGRSGLYTCFSSYGGDVISSFQENLRALVKSAPSPSVATQSGAACGWEYESLIYAQNAHRQAYNRLNVPEPAWRSSPTEEENGSGCSEEVDSSGSVFLPDSTDCGIAGVNAEWDSLRVRNIDTSARRQTDASEFSKSDCESRRSSRVLPERPHRADCDGVGRKRVFAPTDPFEDILNPEKYLASWDTNLLNLNPDLTPVLDFDCVSGVINHVFEESPPKKSCCSTSFTAARSSNDDENEASSSSSSSSTSSCRLSSRLLGEDTQAVIISHPHGGRKVVSSGFFSSHFHVGGNLYDTPTCMGSCGAPVISLAGDGSGGPRVTHLVHAGSVRVNGITTGMGVISFQL